MASSRHYTFNIIDGVSAAVDFRRLSHSFYRHAKCRTSLRKIVTMQQKKKQTKVERYLNFLFHCYI